VRWRRWIGALAAFVVVVGAGWWLTHPAALPAGGDEVGAQARIGEARFVTGIVRPTRPITLRSIEPYRPTGADATVTFRACRNKSSTYFFKTAICEDPRDVGGVVLGDDWDIQAEITLNEDGRFSMQGFLVKYRDGIRFGRQATGTHLFVSTKALEQADE
jgi:hypothetical protein